MVHVLNVWFKIEKHCLVRDCTLINLRHNFMFFKDNVLVVFKLFLKLTKLYYVYLLEKITLFYSMLRIGTELPNKYLGMYDFDQ